jgi:hypothetical protein
MAAMATEIHPIVLEDQTHQGYANANKNPPKYPTEKDGIEVTSTSDLEADIEENEKLIYRAEKTELTPVEAFTWNVDGDQSPC